MLQAFSGRLAMHLVSAVAAAAAWLCTGAAALAQEAAEEAAAPVEAASGGGGLGMGAIILIVVVLVIAVALIVVILKGRSGAKAADKHFQPGPPDRPVKPLVETAREAVAARPPEPAKVPEGALAVLEGIDGPLEGRSYQLTIGHVVIGRDKDECMVHISEDEDPSISRKHAEIVWEDGVWSVRCLTDKTFAVNGEPSAQGSSQALGSGDLITCGRSTFEFNAA